MLNYTILRRFALEQKFYYLKYHVQDLIHRTLCQKGFTDKLIDMDSLRLIFGVILFDTNTLLLQSKT